jgi:tRNA (guanine-N7-)-methyltransferase
MASREHEIRPAMRKAGGFFGRRKGKALRPAQQSRLERLLPRLRIDVGRPCPGALSELFPGKISDFCLEIGCGGGEHLIAQALANPAIGHFGVEPFVNGLAHILMLVEEHSVANVRLHDEDAARLLDWLPASSLSRVDLLYPDPWPKRRHWKRRFVNAANVERIARALRPGGEFRFASDMAEYVNWTLRHVMANPSLAWTAQSADDWRIPWPDWRPTRYEAKATRDQRRPAYLRFRRV